MSNGAGQVGGYRTSRTDVVSGGASSASDLRVPVSAAAPARPAAAIDRLMLRNCRRFCMFASLLHREDGSNPQLFPDLLEEPPVRPRRDDLVGRRLDHAELPQTQRPET